MGTLQRFSKAMKHVYGDFDALSIENTATWNPPAKPGAGGHRGRYLWTDAFGVVNFITLYKETGSPAYLNLAKRLVATVHEVLGRTRDGTARLPGASDAEPLKGGLRIGKLEESGLDGDGQYHHYLTLWMFALHCLALAADDLGYNDLAIQLAKAIHPHFVLHEDGLRMVWKISMDMQRALVPTQGHLDAATGYIVYSLLQKTASNPTVLAREIEDYRILVNQPGALSLHRDLLDLGMSLWMCQLSDESWAQSLGRKALKMVPSTLDDVSLKGAMERLAFREFGACLGARCFAEYDHSESAQLQDCIQQVLSFWEKHLESFAEDDLRPISYVMYAAALVPGAWRAGSLKS